jgi:hypothetical protein
MCHKEWAKLGVRSGCGRFLNTATNFWFNKKGSSYWLRGQCFSTAGPRPATGTSSYERRIYRIVVPRRLRTTQLGRSHVIAWGMH